MCLCVCSSHPLSQTLLLLGISNPNEYVFCALETGTRHSGDNRMPSPNLDEGRGFLWILEPHGMKELGSLSLAMENL